MDRRYATLDGLRGLAAIMVMLLHTDCYRDGFSFTPHSYLAVDFFLMLSGFVIAMSYQQKLMVDLSLVGFFKRRAIRLYPVAIFGVLLGCLKLASEAGLGRGGSEPRTIVVIACALNLFLIPFWSPHFKGDIFPGNSPVWSLFAELVVNVIWSVIAKYRASVSLLIALAALCGSFSLWYISDQGVQPLEYGRFLGPMARMLFAFLIGVLFYNFQSAITKRIPNAVTNSVFLGIALVLILGMQRFGVAWDVISIYLLLPIVLACGIAAGIEPERGIRKFLGDLSYPLYAVHYPIFLLVSGFCHQFLPRTNVFIAMAIGIFISVLCASMLVQFYDERVRRWLSSQLLGQRSSKTGQQTV